MVENDEMKNSRAHLELGSDFYDVVAPATYPVSQLRYFNESAARDIDLSLNTEQKKEHFWSFKAFSDNLPSPLALRYHGHQFLVYNPDLGDGRGFLFAQFYDSQDRLLDLGTKGSGTTPYSRRGDGRLTLKGAFREILATEMLESLGVNTSRTFCVFETGESLQRNDEPSPTRSAVLTRLCHSNIRIGTFQRLYFLQQPENIKKLIEHSVKYYFPELLGLKGPELVQEFFTEVVLRCADLSASLMMTGFVHGVLNTDNINITGEVFDFGPYRFLPRYDLEFTAAYFDHQGLYCYGRQPISFLWALEQLGKALTFAEPDFSMSKSLDLFQEKFNESTIKKFLSRLNLDCHTSKDEVSKIMELFFEFIENPAAGFEQTFFDLYGGASQDRLNRSPQAALYKNEPATELISKLNSAKLQNTSWESHPYWKREKPETLLINEIEDLWKPIVDNDNWAPFEEKLLRIRSFRGLY